MPARALAVVAALLLVMLSLGVTGTAFADPGSGQALGKDDGHGNDGGGSQAASSTAVVDNGTAGNGSSDNSGGGQGNGNGTADDQSAAPQSTASGSSAASTSAKGATNQGQATTQSSSAATLKSDSGTTGSGSKADHSKGNAGTSGTYDQPQPSSTADQNTGGANGQCPGGPYCSTRSGAPSMNGNGGGKAVGKPCAGCVGKADNKNPQGQNPGGGDHNQGYECDGNHGIGRTNPAHTGCTTPPTTCEQLGNCPPPPPPGCVPTPTQDKSCHELPPCVLNPNGPGCVPPPYCTQHPDECVPPPAYCAAHPMSKACLPPPAIEGEEAGPPTMQPVVLGVEAFRPPAGKPAVAPAAAQAGALPSTGAETGMGLAALAGFALLTAGVATLLSRRRTS